MKLEKFYAESMPQAISIIQKKLGAEAIIYSQVQKDNFVEVVAGTPHKEVLPEKPAAKASEPALNNLESSRRVRIRKLDSDALNEELALMEKRHLFQYKMRKLKFDHAFIEKCFKAWSQHCELADIDSDDQIIKMLLSEVRVSPEEFIEGKNICALIGPTGVGKSTTLAKLAKRFISRHGSDSLGIISTDFQRIIKKNQFYYLGKLLNIDIEYARDMHELRQAIELFHEKDLILIDTAGINQNDNEKVAEMLETITIDGIRISLYLVLPCNLQPDILNDVVEHFKLPNTDGCIITKKDESKSIAPCLSVILNHNLRIAYVCDGQNIAKDIHVANKIELINDVFEMA